MANRLANSSSAYLRQHADNAVDWYEWGEEALARARDLDRPIFLSVGYAACHWCHVMAHESFEDPVVAERLNQQFVPIKVDREERPDVDALYMAATQAISGNGGWPMSVFLTPTGRAFMAGTYYPPEDRHGLPGFSRLLDAMADAWRTQRATVMEQADEVGKATERDLRFVDRLTPTSPSRTLHDVDDELIEHLIVRCDDDGGFGSAPKFPRANYVEALLRRFDDPRARSAATRTLDAMARRGLYDHLAGGFARYCVDGRWAVPHFEKMLYDQALLALCYLRADRAAGAATPWRDVATGTINFVLRDLSVPDGLASSLDADSGGHEGAHVTWTPGEVAAALEDAGLGDSVDGVLQRWSIDDRGEFEGRSIPHLAEGEPFRTPPSLQPAVDVLLAVRARRPQPGRDEKVVLEWNAMFLCALFETNDASLTNEATGRLAHLHRTHFERRVWWRTEAQRAHATAADLGWLINAHVSAFEATGEDHWLTAVPGLFNYLLAHYWDGESPRASHQGLGQGLFTTSDLADALVTRPKEIFDAATPSAHGVVAVAAARFAMVAADDDASAVATRLIDLAGVLIDEHPASVPELVRAFGFVSEGREIVIPGAPGPLADLVRRRFVPASVLVTGTGSSPLLHEREVGRAYVCRQRVCSLPVRDLGELAAQLGVLA